MSTVVEKMPEINPTGAALLGENSIHSQSFMPALDAIKKGNDAPAAAPLRNVAAGNSVSPEVTSKTEGLWTCQDRKLDDASGGYFYTFKLDDACDDITEHPQRLDRLREGHQRMMKLFPAGQNQGFHVIYLDPNSKQKFIDAVRRDFMLERYPEVLPGTTEYDIVVADIEDEVMQFVGNNLKHAAVFRRLGYGCECRADGVYLTLPDRTTLLDRWNKLRLDHPELPPLDIVSMDGDVDPATFLDLYLKHDVLLATGREFVHDHLLHVMSAIRLMLDSGTFEEQGEKVTYAAMKKRTRAYIRECYDSFEPHKQELLALGEQIKTGKIPVEHLAEATLFYHKTATLTNLMETLLSAVVDTIASYTTYKNVVDTINTPINEVFIKLLETQQWGSHLAAMTDADGVTLFESEDLERVLYGLYGSLESQ